MAPTLDVLIAEAEALRAAGRVAEAADRYAAWIAADTTPARAVAAFNLGVLRSELGDLAAANAAYRTALEVNPALHQARINAGLVAERLGREQAAVEWWLEAVRQTSVTPGGDRGLATVALNHIGRLQEGRKQYAAAESALRHSLQLDPAQPDAIQHWVHLRQKQCTWPVYDPPPGLAVNDLMGATSPLAMLALLDDPAMQWMTAQTFVRRKYPYPVGRRPARTPSPDSRLRLGYLSGDLCTHAVGLLLGDLLDAHDRTRVHLTAFDFSPEDGSAHRARLLRAFDEVVDIRALDDARAAAAIRARGIDVLMDMHGLSSGARPGILAARPAPQIGMYLGFIGTTALPWLDFVVTDRFTCPAALGPYVTETPLYVDGSLIPLGAHPVAGPRMTRADAGLPDEAVVLASFNNIYKITPTVFAAWMRVLHRVPRAVLWMLDDNPWATAALRERAAAAGLDPARLIFAGRTSHAGYRMRLTLADLFVDTFPYNAGSTARDVLDAGVPIVTLAGRTMVARMAGGLLHAAGLGHLVTGSLEAYEQRIVDLASHPDDLAALSAEIRSRQTGWAAAPARQTRSFEDALFERLTSPTPPTGRR